MNPVLVDANQPLFQWDHEPESCAEVLAGVAAIPASARARGLTLDSIPSSDRGYLVHIFQFRPLELEREKDSWYSYVDSWGNCRFHLGHWLRDVKYRNRYTEKRIWGNNQLSMISVLKVKAIRLRDVSIDHTNPEWRPRVRQLLQSNFQPLITELALLGFQTDLDAFRASGAAALTPDFDRRLFTALLNEFRGERSVDPFDLVWQFGPGVAPVAAVAEMRLRIADDDYLTPHRAAFLRDLRYTWDITKVVPDPQQNLMAALARGAGAAQAGGADKIRIVITPPADRALVARYDEDIREIPSQVKAAGYLTPQPPSGAPAAAAGTGTDKELSLGAATYDNEGRYGWNVNIAVPLKGVDSVTYTDAKGVTPSKIDNKSAFAVFTKYVVPVDTKNTNVRLIPGLFGGPAVSGSFLDSWLVGVSIGLWKVEPYWGMSLLRRQLPGEVVGTTRSDWLAKGVFGFTIPVRGFFESAAKK